jgi:hypothetical protein
VPERLPIADVVERLAEAFGVPPSPPAGTPFEQVLFDVASYLVSDERRLQVHRRLAREVGVTPEAVLRAPREDLLGAVEGGGMKPEMRADRVREAAAVAQQIGDLDAAARAPLAQAVRTFAKFPSIGVPGAEKILLFAGAHAVPALESNGLRSSAWASPPRAVPTRRRTARSAEPCSQRAPRTSASGAARTSCSAATARTSAVAASLSAASAPSPPTAPSAAPVRRRSGRVRSDRVGPRGKRSR